MRVENEIKFAKKCYFYNKPITALQVSTNSDFLVLLDLHENWGEYKKKLGIFHGF